MMFIWMDPWPWLVLFPLSWGCLVCELGLISSLALLLLVCWIRGPPLLISSFDLESCVYFSIPWTTTCSWPILHYQKHCIVNVLMSKIALLTWPTSGQEQSGYIAYILVWFWFSLCFRSVHGLRLCSSLMHIKKAQNSHAVKSQWIHFLAFQ